MAATDVPISFTPIAGGAFPDGYADRQQGGLHIAATTTTRNAIPDYRRETGMLCWVTATSTLYQLKASPWTGSDTDWSIFNAPADTNTGGLHITATTTERNALATYLRKEGMLCWVQSGSGSMYRLVASPWTGTDSDWKIVNTNQIRQRFHFLSGVVTTGFDATTKQVVGNIYYEPISIVPQADPRVRSVIFTAILETVGSGAEANIDIYDLSTPGTVASSHLSVTDSLSPTLLSVDVSTPLASVYTNRILEARLWITTKVDGKSVLCKAAYLDLIFA